MTPPPSQLPPVPPISRDAHHSVRAPTKCINSEADVHTWLKSEAHDVYLLFVARLAAAATGKPTRTDAWSNCAHDAIGSVISLLRQLDAWTDEIELSPLPQRFGNKAFREWGARLEAHVDELHTALLPTHLLPYVPELRAYLLGGFGSFSRLDYGTGHEMSFVAWLAMLYRLGFFDESSSSSSSSSPPPPSPSSDERLALEVFPAYLRVAWHIQDRYALEPAGSHGAWGLDDYHFIPYVIGAAQLATAGTTLSPQQVISPMLYPFLTLSAPRSGPRISLQDTLTHSTPRLAGSAPMPNLYISAIARINSLKRGPFTEHSPILSDIARS
ncbi:Serine/threonine-protein phosphatase 2A activator 1 [Malassezia cuniculi]|uniref:Serine/threonine-protein phosphatase 2A activator n=1 Tax=Malassezia cuniculi TaxID=948313 RepID=A0AAF0J5W1_9BASI|nr:Serine/threonine-protein phosphatase 2A activator 1 [Malassezia cuniculi]